jgi:glucose/arabinose dehydrogenase
VRAVAASFVAALALPFATTGTAWAEVRLQPVGTFAAPVHLAGAPGDGERLYVVERAGTIRVVRGGSSTVFADLTGPVEASGGEEGLLSVAFAPDFQTSRLLYVFFTNGEAGHDLEIAELRAPTADAADVGSLRRVLEIEHDEANNHNGGQLQFGPDGYLYISTGDGGNSYDLPNNDAASTSSLLGKILRIDPRGTAEGEHVIPADNPFGTPVWSYGLRNPWRFSFDRSTGDLVIGDVGQNTVEEVNYAPAAHGGGRRTFFGWHECEGNFDANPSPTRPAEPCTLQNDVPPTLALMQDGGFCSVIGGYVVRDPTLPSLFGRYVYGDLCVSELRSARLDGVGPIGDAPIDPPVRVPSLTSFGEDSGGCLYVTSHAGGVSRIVDTDTRIPCQPTEGGGGPAGAGAAGGGTGGGGGGTTGAGGGPSVTVRDTVGPRLTARVKRRQRVLRRGGLVAHARCNEPCSIAAGGWIRVGARVRRLRRDVRFTPADRPLRIEARLTAEGRRALRGALFRGRPAKLRMGLRARDASGNPSALLRHTVRVGR